jgi:hypothetical protein
MHESVISEIFHLTFSTTMTVGNWYCRKQTIDGGGGTVNLILKVFNQGSLPGASVFSAFFSMLGCFSRGGSDHLTP